MKNTLTHLTRRPLMGVLAGALAVALSAGCSSAPKTADDVPVEAPEKSEQEKISEATGIPLEALQAFEEALAAMKVGATERATAIEALERAIEIEPTFAEAHYNLGLLYGEIDRSDEAVEHIQTARELDPDVFDYTVALAKAFAENEQYDDAQELFSEVVARDENNLVAKNNMAVIALRRGEEDQALRYVEEILREDNVNVGAL